MENTKFFEQFNTHFNTHFDYLTESIFSYTIWAEDVDVDTCRMIASQLELIADENADLSKSAAAIYCLICAYDNHEGTFSPETACRLIFEHEAIDVYRKILQERFSDIFDESFYEEMEAFPAMQLLKSFAKGD